jgi:hypothetical protein
MKTKMPIFATLLLAVLSAACSQPVTVAGDSLFPTMAAAVIGSFTPSPSLSSAATSTPTGAATNVSTVTVSVTASPTGTPTATATPTPTVTASTTATQTLTLVPYAVVQPPEGSSQGSYLRVTPQGTNLGLLPRGTVVILLPGTPVEQGGLTWVHVRVLDTGREGWLAERNLSRMVFPPGCDENVPALLGELTAGNDGHGYFLDVSYGVLPGMVRYLQANFVSSGVFETLTIPLDEGAMLQVDVVWAYSMPKGVLIAVPVALGARFPDGRYVPFSNPLAGVPVWQDLQDGRESLYRGRLFYDPRCNPLG